MNVIIHEKSYPYDGEAVDILEAFRHEPYPFLLESSLRHPSLGRFSFIGFDPFLVMAGRQEQSLARLQKHFYHFAPQPLKSGYPFPGGIMGYLSYDFGLRFEPAVKRHSSVRRDSPSIPDYLFGFYDRVIVIDHYAGRLIVLSTGLPEKNDSCRRRRAKERLNEAVERLKVFSFPKPQHPLWPRDKTFPDDMPFFASNFNKADYLKAVARALEYIRQGEIYQVNLSQRFCFNGNQGKKAWDPLTLYRTLRQLSPSCFAGYFDSGDFQIISSSPERFLQMHGGIVQTRPMKGTRPRGRDRIEDRDNEKELWNSRKDIAELLMITDLERNDLGRVCRTGSVKVKDIRSLEKYATVFQTTSTIEGVLDKDKDIFDCLEASFPGGSITGCPKIRAMQIIDELEPSPRSIYTGAMGYVSFWGDVDFNILIRTFLAHKRRIYFHAGGGIVADSVPEWEYEETLVKAKAMKDCLGLIFRDKKDG